MLFRSAEFCGDQSAIVYVKFCRKAGAPRLPVPFIAATARGGSTLTRRSLPFSAGKVVAVTMCSTSASGEETPVGLPLVPVLWLSAQAHDAAFKRSLSNVRPFLVYSIVRPLPGRTA